MDLKGRLRKGDITLAELMFISYDYYKKVDDKAWRSSIDIKSARLIRRTNFSFNRQKGTWEQTGRDVRMQFMVRSEPTSYKHDSPLKVHWYPCTFVIHNIGQGIYSPVKLRAGSNFKPKFPTKGMSKEQRKQIEKINLRNGVQLGAFFTTQWVFKQFGILFGPCYANRAPLITNPDLIPFLSKHEFYIANKILTPLLGKTGLRLRELWKNE